MQQDVAETVAIRALAWLAATDDLLGTFMAATGIGLDDIRRGAGDPDFLVSVLDFVMLDDRWVVAFCEAEGLAADDPMAARRALPGGCEVHWT